jgi:antitoxin component YwqK of YwqJK toxin-antitoxin module
MIIRFIFIISLFSVLSIKLSASGSDTIWNQTDKNGYKQGFWKVNYESGIIKYQGYFKNNIPVGEMKRYYDDGKIKAVMYFYESGKKSKAQIYYQNGVLWAEGNFIESMKDSIWKYYSFYDKTLKLAENYTNGVKEGLSVKYHENGKIAEEIEWKNNQKNGKWKQYYKNETVKLSASYINDKRTGEFSEFYPSAKIEMQGKFVDNMMQGDWLYFDEEGKVKMRIIYKYGVPQNASQLEEKEREYFKLIDQNKGKIPEPDENSLVPTK